MSTVVLAMLAGALLSLGALTIDYGVLGAARQATLSAAGEAVQAASRQLSAPAARAAATEAVAVITAHACASTTIVMSGTFSPGATIRVSVTCRMHVLPLVGAGVLHASEAGIVATAQDVSAP